ncbi:hypothetical protein RLEG3_03545 (plasmid) [Rhizobium leguminosarum bv. trifolii WSM1689]|nr:hypothetical protein RLEG3_03545 [Rhizobium leguminosarum bv. trifolii WSM1689]
MPSTIKPELIAFGTLQSIAIECSVAPTTIVRAARLAGFETFADFKAMYQLYLREIGSGAESQRRSARDARCPATMRGSDLNSSFSDPAGDDVLMEMRDRDLGILGIGLWAGGCRQIT